jgi:hypothetical protein
MPCVISHDKGAAQFARSEKRAVPPVGVSVYVVSVRCLNRKSLNFKILKT